MGRRVLFVCSANQTRSPIAAKMFEKMLQRAGIGGIEVMSAGTFSGGGEPASATTREMAATMGLDLSAHKSSLITTEMIRSSDLILVMEELHRASIINLCPDLDDRVRLLSSFVPYDGPDIGIPDPTGLPPLAYRSCFARILESLEGLLRTIQNEWIVDNLQ